MSPWNALSIEWLVAVFKKDGAIIPWSDFSTCIKSWFLLYNSSMVRNLQKVLNKAFSCDPSGNLQNPAYVANFLESYPQPFSFFHRIKNIFLSVVVPYKWKDSTREAFQGEVRMSSCINVFTFFLYWKKLTSVWVSVQIMLSSHLMCR